MNKQQELTQDQLNEIKELAQTNTLKEIASHFNMSKQTFLIMRKQQPEIDIIYQKILRAKRNKIYTAEEILEIENMLKTSNMESIAKHLRVSIPVLTKTRSKQPKLEKAIIRGMQNRPSNFNYLRQKEAKKQKEEKFTALMQQEEHQEKQDLKTAESLSTRAPEFISPEEAIVRFRELKEEEKAKRKFQELKEIDL